MRCYRLLWVLVFVTPIFTGTTGVFGEESSWPRWRGPHDIGMADGEAPISWGDDENIKWKSAIPGRGYSSPVVWGKQVFLTTAIPTGDPPKVTEPPPPPPPPPPGQQGRRRGRRGFGRNTGPQAEHKFDVLCLDKENGALLWQETAITAVPHEGFHRRYGSFASNSPVTDGQHLFAFFGSRGVYCYDTDGKLIWKKDFGVKMRMRLGFGEGTAAVLHGNILILNFDHEGDSFIVALEKSSGDEIWRVPRDEASNWAPPLVLKHDGQKQIIVSATNRVRSYDLVSGELIWECGGLGLNTIPAPVHNKGILYVMSGFRKPNLLAIRLGGIGDLTGSDSVIWSNDRGNSYTPSPVLYDDKLYLLTDKGLISCLDAKTGEPYYQQSRLPGPHNFKASPVGADGKLYLASENGDVFVLKMGPELEVIATNTLADQVFISSPAIADGNLFLRSEKYLFCIGD